MKLWIALFTECAPCEQSVGGRMSAGNLYTQKESLKKETKFISGSGWGKKFPFDFSLASQTEFK